MILIHEDERLEEGLGTWLGEREEIFGPVLTIGRFQKGTRYCRVVE